MCECIFCSLEKPRTVDCRNLRKASNQFFSNRQDGQSYYSPRTKKNNQQKGQSSSFVATEQNDNSAPISEDVNQQDDPKDDVSYATAHCYKDRDVFDWFSDSGATQHIIKFSPSPSSV